MSGISNMELKKSFKGIGDANPVMTQRFGADPYGLVYDGRVYLYMTGDDFMYDENGEIIENNYSNIYTINVISSADMVNWTDHGCVYAASSKGQATWGNNAWAPAAAYKEIDGKMKFFLYFANSGNGIAVLSADSPIGPFTDPINGPLISREKTPTCAEVTWLFDPAVLMDDDGEAYIYFGGGVPSDDKAANPGTARMAKLGQDMISLDGDPIAIENVAYLFEDSGINKINGKYYYSYCSNFSIPEEKRPELGYDQGEINVMVSDQPLGPFTFYKPVLKNPEFFFGLGGNNHHCMFEFKGQLYMAYHSRISEEAMGVLKGYRCTGIDAVNLDANGDIETITMTRKGVAQVGSLNPYEKTDATTMAIMAGISTTQYGEQSIQYGSGDMIVTDITTGSWIGVYGANFADKGANAIEVEVRGTGSGKIYVCIDSLEGDVVAEVEVKPESANTLSVAKAQLSAAVNGKHDVYFVFEGSDFEVKSWKFSE
ncbi:MAG: glycoside hydrolase family 43 protein [Eubacteriales bacterium]|nr:glycoside hydrolase family 43 protein [Eubacteriales bacterium]